MMRHLGVEFVRRGVRCDLIVATDKGPLLETSLPGLNVVRLHKRNSRHAIIALARYLREHRPDVVMSTVFSANIAAIVAVKILCRGMCRLVIREAARTDIQLGTHRGIRRITDSVLRKLLYPLADFAVAVSKDVLQSLLNENLLPSNRACVIYNPLTRPLRSGADHSIEHDSLPVILACGRLEEEKDYPTLLRAVDMVAKTRPVSLVILGDGSMRGELEQLANRLGIAECVEFAGFVEDIVPYLERTSIFVHTSRFEGFPSAVLEAAASGCPVVATDSPGGAREILRDGDFGTLVPVGDSAAVAQAILDILERKVRRRESDQYFERFSLPNAATEYLRVLFPDQSPA